MSEEADNLCEVCGHSSWSDHYCTFCEAEADENQRFHKYLEQIGKEEDYERSRKRTHRSLKEA